MKRPVAAQLAVPLVAALLVPLLVSPPARAQATPAAAPAAAIDAIAVRDLASRLAALTPQDPAATLRLAEEVAAERATQGAGPLAVHLYVLAFEHARTSPGEPQTAVSAALGLAQLEPVEQRRTWLRAVADVLDPRRAAPDWGAAIERPLATATALAAAEAIGNIRAGQGNRAEAALREPEVREVFDRYSGILTGAGQADVLRNLDAHAAIWPCPECRNDRVSVFREGEEPELRICRTCNGDPGWRPDPARFLATLRFEAAVLRGPHRSWSAQLAADLGAPLRDPDPAEIAPTYRVDPAAYLYRDGAWSRP